MSQLAQRDPGLDDGTLAGMWSQFASTQDEAVRAGLIGAYQPFARVMAAKAYARRVDQSVEFDDYLQYARLGLLQSIDRFDPRRGFKFETFAASRITGAILDGVASATELHEQVAARRILMRKRLKALDGATAGAAAPADVFARLAELAIGLAVGFMLEGTGMHVGEEVEADDHGYACLELKQLRAQVRAALTQLTPNQRRMVELHYLQQLPMGEIALIMQLTPGRISQLHGGALVKLKTVLTQRAAIDLAC